MVKRRLLALSFFSLFACFLAACGDTTANSGSIVTPGTTPTPAPAQKHFKITDTVKVGDTWQLNINSVKSSPGQDFSTPKSGNVFLLIDVTLKNLSSQEQNVSSLLMFHLKDDTGQTYTEAITGFTTSPNGKLEAGGLLRGTIAYEVPAAQKAFTLAFEASLIDSGQTIFDITTPAREP